MKQRKINEKCRTFSEQLPGPINEPSEGEDEAATNQRTIWPAGSRSLREVPANFEKENRAHAPAGSTGVA